MNYVYLVESCKNCGGEVVMGGLAAATSTARRRARRLRVAQIIREPETTSPPYSTGFRFGRTVRVVASNGRVTDVNLRPQLHVLHAAGLGDVLTDSLCNQQAFARNWQQRLSDSLGTSAQAAILGGAAAGLLGALIGRPLLGIAGGAATAWAAHAIWTAPLRP